MAIPTRALGKNGPAVAEIGFGLMGMSVSYGTAMKDEDAFNILDKAIELGSTFWDTSDAYGGNEELIGRYFKARPGAREKVFLATKFGFYLDENGVSARGDEEYILQQSSASLKKLGVSYIDLYYIHRVDPKVPIEKTMRVLKGLVEKGIIRHIGISEATANTIRRAHAVYPLSAFQMEYSAFSLVVEDEQTALGSTCRELGISIVAYSPLGRGILTGRIKSNADFAADDFRRQDPRYSPENFQNNLVIVDKLQAFADRHNATPGQIALAWLLAQSPDLFIIPGTTKIPNLEENVAAGKLKLAPAELEELNTVIRKADIKGERYGELFNAMNLVDTPAE